MEEPTMIDAPKVSTPETLSPGGEPCTHAPSGGDPCALALPPDPLTAHYKLWTLYLVACSVGCILGSCLLWNATSMAFASSTSLRLAEKDNRWPFQTIVRRVDMPQTRAVAIRATVLHRCSANKLATGSP
jgi:hypothetical protein